MNKTSNIENRRGLQPTDKLEQLMFSYWQSFTEAFFGPDAKLVIRPAEQRKSSRAYFGDSRQLSHH